MTVSPRDMGEVEVERPSRGLPYVFADHKGHDARFEAGAYQDGSGVILYCIDCGENVAWTAFVPPEPSAQSDAPRVLTNVRIDEPAAAIISPDRG